MKLFILTLFLPIMVFAGRLQNSDFATLSELISRGASATSLLNDTKVYVSSNGINKQLSQAISDGDIGGGGSGMSGLNLIANPDFEKSVTTGWVTSGTVVSQTAYTAPTTYNKFYANIITTTANGYYETLPASTPTMLANSDLQTQSYVRPVSGTWSIQAISGTTVIASQTLTVNNNFYLSPLILTPSGPVNTQFKLRYTAIASGSVLGVDNNYQGQVTNFQNGAIVGPNVLVGTMTIGATTTPPTKGAVSYDRLSYSRIGPKAEITYDYRQTGAGSPGSGDYLYSLPAGLSFDLSKVTIYTGATTALTTNALHVSLVPINSGAFSDATNGQFTYISVYSATQFRLITLLAPNSGGFHSSTNAPFSNANLSFKFTFSAFIDGWQGTGVSFDSRCANDIACQSVFSATFNTGGITQAEGVDWINGNASGTSPYVITFNTGVFTSAPNCTASFNVISAGEISVSSTATTVSVQLYASTGTPSSGPFTVHCVRGTDYVTKQSVQGYLSQTVAHTSSNLLKMYAATINNINGSSAIVSQPPGPSWISTNSCAGAGQCTYTITAGVFSNANSYWCTFGPRAATGGTSSTFVKNSATSIEIITYNGTTPANMSTEIMCMGY